MKILNKGSFALFIAPALLLFVCFFAGPIMSGLYYGFTDWNGLSFRAKFIGLSNFKEALVDPLLGTALKNTIVLSAVTIAVQHAAALLLAVLLDQKLKGVHWMRSVLFFPAILNTVVIGFIWSYMYAPILGVFSKVFDKLNLHGLSATDWLGNPDLAIYSISLVIVWQSAGYSMMIYLAGLQTIPTSLYEAASIDGAGSWQKLRRITLPLLIPAIIVNTVLSVIGCLKQFEHIFIMTRGGPVNSTQVFGTLIYELGFSGSRMGYGTAMSLMLSVLILIVTFVQIRLLSRLEVKY